MSICNECWGKGWIEKQGVQFDCRKCKGTGVIENEPQTNEEWFCSLPLTEKSEWLADFCKFIIESTEGGNDVKWATTKTYWDVWFNGAHHDMSGM